MGWGALAGVAILLIWTNRYHLLTDDEGPDAQIILGCPRLTGSPRASVIEFAPGIRRSATRPILGAPMRTAWVCNQANAVCFQYPVG